MSLESGGGGSCEVVGFEKREREKMAQKRARVRDGLIFFFFIFRKEKKTSMGFGGVRSNERTNERELQGV